MNEKILNFFKNESYFFITITAKGLFKISNSFEKEGNSVAPPKIIASNFKRLLCLSDQSSWFLDWRTAWIAWNSFDKSDSTIFIGLTEVVNLIFNVSDFLLGETIFVLFAVLKLFALAMGRRGAGIFGAVFLTLEDTVDAGRGGIEGLEGGLCPKLEEVRGVLRLVSSTELVKLEFSSCFVEIDSDLESELRGVVGVWVLEGGGDLAEFAESEFDLIALLGCDAVEGGGDIIFLMVFVVAGGGEKILCSLALGVLFDEGGGEDKEVGLNIEVVA